jgi:DNA polymerase I-like protein with 3'-5' exonuclease and polymerase domains/5'-3' exonuclease
MKIAVDLSSVIWNCMNAGTDPQQYKVEYEGKSFTVRTAAHGYEYAVNSIKSVLDKYNASPRDLIIVIEGANSKAPRLMIDKDYKSQRGKRCPEQYQEFGLLRDRLVTLFRNLGALAIQQDNVEGDDVIAWLAKTYPGKLVIKTTDNDMAALNSDRVIVDIAGDAAVNKYGDFPFEYVTLYKAMVGDSSDNIKGIKGFGPAAWIDFDRQFGAAGMKELTRLAEKGSLEELALEATQNDMVARIYEGAEDFLRSYQCAKMHPEWVNTLSNPITYLPGLVQPTCDDERLAKYKAQMRLITADNYDAAVAFFKSKITETAYFPIDLETSTPEESDDWLAAAGSDRVDVIASKITGGSVSFGANGQYAYYISVDHKDTNNVTMKQFGDLLRLIPTDKLSVAHNAQGFELPVLFMEFGQEWADNGWRGFFPNLVDSRIAASHWDENQFSFGLKTLTKKLFGYDQTSYAEVTGGLKMNQIPATQVLAYGCDDVYTSGALWDFFSFIMTIEGTLDAFIEIEQKPMYLQALSYCQGIKLDMPKLQQLSAADQELEKVQQVVLDKSLIKLGWEGTVCPTYVELTPANVKEAVQIISGIELKTAVRTISKLSQMVRETGNEQCILLANLIDSNDVVGINALVATHFSGHPEMNVGSPKQLKELLYDKLGMPVRLRNKPTQAMRDKGIREGTPRTDEDAVKMAIKMGDVPEEHVDALKALMELKFINTRRSLYWDAYPKLLHWKTGRLHPELRQSATNTRRYAGSAPNIQQQDSTPGGVRSTCIPHKRNAIVVSLDESAQEVRQLADYCQDANLLTCYLGTKEQLRDVHSIVACKIAGCTYEEFRARLKSGDELSAKQRQAAKITLFATIYGAAAPKIAEGLGITEAEAQEYIDAIYAQFPDVKAWKEASEDQARRLGFVEIHGGTIRHLASLVLSDDKYTAAKAMRQAGNARIQGAGGNQIKRIMSRIWDSRLIEDYDYRWYFSVHDETVHSVAREHAVPVIKILHGFMTEQFLKTVPSASSIGVGRSFGELNELGEVFDEEAIAKAVEAIFQ